MRVNRYDMTGELSPPQWTPEGFMILDGRAARIGLQEYVGKDGKVRHELRLPEEVFKPESMRSAGMLTVTTARDGEGPHPEELLTPETVEQYQIGQTGQNVRRAGDWLLVPMKITARRGIDALARGRQQLSSGYSAEMDEVSGEYQGDPCPSCGTRRYDSIQRAILHNHLAIVDEARAGDAARVRLDSGDAIVLASRPDPSHPSPTQEAPMKSLRIDGLTYQLADSTADADNIQAAIDRAMKVERDRVAAEKLRADSAAELAARARAGITSIRVAFDKRAAKKDAMKARMMACDECAGKGTMDGAKCDYCDGAGKLRMHDAVKTAMEPEEHGSVAPDTDVADEDGDDEMEDAIDGAEGDLEAPAEKGKADAATRRERRKSTRIATRRADAERLRGFRAKHRASRARIDSRRVKARVALEVEAQKHLGAVKFDGKSDMEIRRAVLGKLMPDFKLDGRSDDAISIAYDMEIARLPSAIDRARAGAGPNADMGASNGDRGDGKSGNERQADAWVAAAGKPAQAQK